MNISSSVDSGSSPLNEFSQCHVGILTHLRELDTLPAILETAARARDIAAHTLGFFRRAVFEHHEEEERELFTAVLASSAPGEERERVKAITKRLSNEHRQIEAQWTNIEPELKAVAKGHASQLDGAAVKRLVEGYEAHARYEEEVFLPLSANILGRNGKHMEALGLSLHMRHTLPGVLKRFAGRI